MCFFIDTTSLSSSILNNNNMTSRNFNSFSDKKKYFIRILRIPPVVPSCHIFIKKTSVVANVNVSAIFTHHFVRNGSQFVIL